MAATRKRFHGYYRKRAIPRTDGRYTHRHRHCREQPEEVLRWYDRGKQRPRGWWRTAFQEDKVAQAIVDRYPDRSIDIWKKVAEREIAHAKPSAYEAAGSYLGKVSRALTKLGREKEWGNHLTKLKETHRRKRRLMEVLDGLSQRRIIDRA